MSDFIKVLAVNTPKSFAGVFDHYIVGEVSSSASEQYVPEAIASFGPDVIISFGSLDEVPDLFEMSLHIRKKWIHFENMPTDDEIDNAVKSCYKSLIYDDREFSEILISVITPTYKTKDIYLAYRSMISQTYQNWEWVLYDDGSDDEDLEEKLQRISKYDPRVKYFPMQHSGKIGEVKHNAFHLASGDILVELDHDDELTPWCLASIKEAHDTFPDAGFYYTDCAEVTGENHENAKYVDGWGFGYGSYRTEYFRNRDYAVSNYPDLNSKTIRHIVGVPNHARAWKRDFYLSIGGHNVNLHVADDYEILVRTWLKTQMVHIRRFGYIQYHHESNTQKTRNAEIQRLVALIHQVYEPQIHARFEEFGIPDYIWKDGSLDWAAEPPSEKHFTNYELF